MWLFTQIGFFSVVEHKENMRRVLVRARFGEDLAKLKALASEMGLGFSDIAETPDHDYRFRATMKKADWAKLLHGLAEDITYTNFKRAVHGNPIRDRAYMACWSAMRRAQDEPS